ncbi:hypothetical protein SAMN04488047_1059 [Tranquillimonas alkanivorans]|uniref:Uncharacterized protein n=1 Tax=Tranquillimonas alkanivorans TaxID=441119 RepID=A0A1I5PBU5_9RHOB|nr:hypothetical protein SAMN04488047_1059 [Tranquillimonas alkanivorans]
MKALANRNWHLATGPTAPLRHFIEEHEDTLIKAARLLGGPDGVALAMQAVQRLRQESWLSGGTRRRLHALVALLALEHVHDHDRVEGGYFAALDPGSAEAEEVCLLVDRLRAAMDECAGAEARLRRPAMQGSRPAA